MDVPIDDIGEWDALVTNLIAVMNRSGFKNREPLTVKDQLASSGPRVIGLSGWGFSIKFDRI